jgi:hypothetical protein
MEARAVANLADKVVGYFAPMRESVRRRKMIRFSLF